MEVRAHYPGRTPVEFGKGRHVLYRDPDLFHAGKPCTFLCKVTGSVRRRRYFLEEIPSGRRFTAAPEYMRPIDITSVMRDIDMAPLAEDDAVSEMPSAAVAWLRQQARKGGAK